MLSSRLRTILHGSPKFWGSVARSCLRALHDVIWICAPYPVARGADFSDVSYVPAILPQLCQNAYGKMDGYSIGWLGPLPALLYCSRWDKESGLRLRSQLRQPILT